MPFLNRFATNCFAGSIRLFQQSAAEVPTGQTLPLFNRLATTRLAHPGRRMLRSGQQLVPDLLTAAWDALAADADLAVLLGRPAEGSTGWLWYEADGLPPTRATRPYLILGPLVGPTTRLEAPGRGIAVASELQATAYGDRDWLVPIGDGVARALRKTPLRFTGGSVAAIWRINPFEGGVRDPGHWPGGETVWSQVLRFRVLMGGSV